MYLIKTVYDIVQSLCNFSIDSECRLKLAIPWFYCLWNIVIIIIIIIIASCLYSIYISV
jgi:hypothetical protein